MEWLNHVIQNLQAGLHALPLNMNLVWIVLLMTTRLCQMAATYVLMSNNISVLLLSAAPHANLNGHHITSVTLNPETLLLLAIVN